MTDDLRERVLAMADRAEGSPSPISRRLAIAVAAMVMEECARMAETFGNAPPNPTGRRAKLAAAIRQRTEGLR